MDDDRFKKTGNVEGTEVRMNGMLFEIPALNFRQVRKMKDTLKDLRLPSSAAAMGAGGEAEDEALTKFFEVIHAAMSRNYGNLKLEDLDELIDLNNLVKVVQAVMNVSGLVRLGETLGAKVPAPQSPQTGT